MIRSFAIGATWFYHWPVLHVARWWWGRGRDATLGIACLAAFAAVAAYVIAHDYRHCPLPVPGYNNVFAYTLGP